MDPKNILSKTFSEVNNYDQQVVLKDISFDSYCEHHFAPITGKVHIGYLPKDKVVGLSKLARLVDVFAKRLQVQEKMTSQIATTLQTHLDCRGVGVVVEAEHHCMCTRGVNKKGTTMRTSFFTGEFSKDLVKRNDFLNSII
jgi:GTP cyclohydrolase I